MIKKLGTRLTIMIEDQKYYFSLDGWIKYIASMVGNGCLLLYMSSTTVSPKKQKTSDERRKITYKKK